MTLAPRNSKTYAISMRRLVRRLSRCPEISLQSAEVRATEKRFKISRL